MNTRTIYDATWQFVQEKLLQQWSPEQICRHAVISHEVLYQRIYTDKRAGGILWQQLSCQKQRWKHYGKTDRRGIISNRRTIENHPPIIDECNQIGNCEVDFVIGKHHQQTIVSLVERRIGLDNIQSRAPDRAGCRSGGGSTA